MIDKLEINDEVEKFIFFIEEKNCFEVERKVNKLLFKNKCELNCFYKYV